MPWLGYGTDVARAVAFHFMAIGQLLLTYPSRHTWAQPLPNRYLLLAVVSGVAIQFGAAGVPFFARMLGNASLPVELWGVVCVGALVAWGSAELIAQWVWRAHVTAGAR